jgi:CelD/BcsL family acetyltransferase involved in cellulose biosynthesis
MSEVERLRPLWEEIQKRTPATIFQDFDWNLLALQMFSEEKPFFVAAESQSSVTIIPAVIRENQVRFAGGSLFDYRDVICAGGDTALSAAFETLVDTDLSWSIHGVRNVMLSYWSRLAVEPWTAAPFVSPKDISPDAFAEKHTRARRSLRRLADLGASIRMVIGRAELVEQLYREKANEPAAYLENVFRDPRCIEFMRNVVSLPQTHCDIFLMEAAGSPIAALVTFRDGDVRRFYTTWMDQRWSKHSPGIALLYHATCETLAAGLDCDYMTGEQPYKMRFATGSVPLYKLECSAAELGAHFAREELKAA